MTENAVCSTILKELAANKSITYFTIGTSMRPLLTERKTHVTISPLTTVKKNDILLYYRATGSLVLHRLIKEDSRYYYMRGDNTYGLEPIQKDQAVGVVTQIYRKGKIFDPGSSIYRLYVAVWNTIYPLRWLIRQAKAAARRLLR